MGSIFRVKFSFVVCNYTVTVKMASNCQVFIFAQCWPVIVRIQNLLPAFQCP